MSTVIVYFDTHRGYTGVLKASDGGMSASWKVKVPAEAEVDHYNSWPEDQAPAWAFGY